MSARSRATATALIVAGALAGTALAVNSAATLELGGGGISSMVVVTQSTETEYEPGNDWADSLARVNVAIPTGEVGLVRVRFSGATFCAAGLVGTADCRMRVTYRRLGAATWIPASPGSVRVDGLFETRTEAFEAVTAPLNANTYEIRIELWAAQPGTIFGFTDYAIVIERILE